MTMDNCKHLFSENNILPHVVAELSLHSRLRSTEIKKLDNLMEISINLFKQIIKNKIIKK